MTPERMKELLSDCVHSSYTQETHSDVKEDTPPEEWAELEAFFGGTEALETVVDHVVSQMWAIGGDRMEMIILWIEKGS